MRTFMKVLSVTLCLMITAMTLSVCCYAEETATEVVVGDVNADGSVDTSDAQLALKMAARIVTPDMERADVDGDGYMSVKDVIAILNLAMNPPQEPEEPGTEIVIPDKNGDNWLSFSPENEYIKLVSDRFGVNPDALAAIYSVPDSGTNYVLQFKKSTFGNTYEKSVDNLYRVYHIGKAPERELSYTDGNLIFGDHYNCTAAEGVLVFNLVQTQVMPQYPDYFEGV